MTDFIILIVTVLSIFLIIYHHIFYPLIIRFLAHFKTPKLNDHYPKNLKYLSITLVMPAYNEERFMADKIRNIAILDYPSDKLKVLIVNDGSTDKTFKIAIKTSREKECRGLAIKVINLPKNIGKVRVLNHALKHVHSEITALTDVSALLSIDALKQAIKHFKNPKTGVVNGNYRLLTPGSYGEKKYWEYQSKIKNNESKLGSVIGSHGAFYLFRTKLFKALPKDTINDDFIIPMEIVKKGYDSVLEPNINAVELEKSDLALDTQRRYRISAGNTQQAMRLLQLLFPKYKGTAFTFASGKFLRVLIPYLILISFIGCFYLSHTSWIFYTLFISQCIIYSQYIILSILKKDTQFKVLKTINYLIYGYKNSLIGSLKYLKQWIINKINQHVIAH